MEGFDILHKEDLYFYYQPLIFRTFLFVFLSRNVPSAHAAEFLSLIYSRSATSILRSILGGKFSRNIRLQLSRLTKFLESHAVTCADSFLPRFSCPSLQQRGRKVDS